MTVPQHRSVYDLVYVPEPGKQPTSTLELRPEHSVIGRPGRSHPPIPPSREILRAEAQHTRIEEHPDIRRRVPEELLPPELTTLRCDGYAFSIIETHPLMPGYIRAEIHLCVYKIRRGDTSACYLEVVDREVTSEYRRGGLGAQLLAVAEDVARRNGCDLIWGVLAPEHGAPLDALIGQHRRAGYEIVERGESRPLAVKRRPETGWAEYRSPEGESPVLGASTEH